MGGIEKIDRPFNKWATYEGHGGIDYGQDEGTPIPASHDGIVTFAKYYSERGGYAVFVDYGLGYLAGYYHINSASDIKVKVGDTVKRGTTLALVGQLGKYSTGPHLHHEIWVNGNIIKPPYYWNYVNDGDNDYVGATETKIKENEMGIIYIKDEGGKRGSAQITGGNWEKLRNSEEEKSCLMVADKQVFLDTRNFDLQKNIVNRHVNTVKISDADKQDIIDGVLAGVNGLSNAEDIADAISNMVFTVKPI